MKYCVYITNDADEIVQTPRGIALSLEVNSLQQAWIAVDLLWKTYRAEIGAITFISPPYVKRDTKAKDILRRPVIVATSDSYVPTFRKYIMIGKV